MSKLVHALISPLGTALLLGFVAIVGCAVARARKARQAAWGLAAAAFAWLWFWSTPIASEALRGWLEDQAGPRSIAAVRPGPVIVVLGGGVSGPKAPRRLEPDLGRAADRVWYAARLHAAGKAPLLLLSGGTLRDDEPPEADAMRTLLRDLGVPDDAILRERRSRNTRENAEETARMLRQRGIGSAILVTSALHMRRARTLFERVGIAVTPAPTDWEVVTMPFEFVRLLPDADALEGSARAMKELVGRAVGR